MIYYHGDKSYPSLVGIGLNKKLQDTSGRKPSPAARPRDTSGPLAFWHFWPEVFGQVRPRDKSSPKTRPALRQVWPWHKSSPKTSQDQKCLDKYGPEIYIYQSLLLSFFIKQQFQAPETSPALRHVQPWDISGTKKFLSLRFFPSAMDLNISKMMHTLYDDYTQSCTLLLHYQKESMFWMPLFS